MNIYFQYKKVGFNLFNEILEKLMFFIFMSHIVKINVIYVLFDEHFGYILVKI